LAGIGLVNELIGQYRLDVVHAYMAYIQENAANAVRDMLRQVAKGLPAANVCGMHSIWGCFLGVFGVERKESCGRLHFRAANVCIGRELLQFVGFFLRGFGVFLENEWKVAVFWRCFRCPESVQIFFFTWLLAGIVLFFGNGKERIVYAGNADVAGRGPPRRRIRYIRNGRD
jgi:hypothetical protein